MDHRKYPTRSSCLRPGAQMPPQGTTTAAEATTMPGPPSKRRKPNISQQLLEIALSNGSERTQRTQLSKEHAGASQPTSQHLTSTSSSNTRTTAQQQHTTLKTTFEGLPGSNSSSSTISSASAAPAAVEHQAQQAQAQLHRQPAASLRQQQQLLQAKPQVKLNTSTVSAATVAAGRGAAGGSTVNHSAAQPAAPQLGKFAVRGAAAKLLQLPASSQLHSSASLQGLRSSQQPHTTSPNLAAAARTYQPLPSVAAAGATAAAPAAAAFSNCTYWRLAAALDSPEDAAAEGAAGGGGAVADDIIPIVVIPNPTLLPVPAAGGTSAAAGLPTKRPDQHAHTAQQQQKKKQQQADSPSSPPSSYQHSSRRSRGRLQATPAAALLRGRFSFSREDTETPEWSLDCSEQLHELQEQQDRTTAGYAAAGGVDEGAGFDELAFDGAAAGEALDEQGSGMDSHIFEATPDLPSSSSCQPSHTAQAHTAAAGAAAGARLQHWHQGAAGLGANPGRRAEAEAAEEEEEEDVSLDDADAAVFLEACLNPDVVAALAVLVHSDLMPFRNRNGSGSLLATLAYMFVITQRSNMLHSLDTHTMLTLMWMTEAFCSQYRDSCAYVMFDYRFYATGLPCTDPLVRDTLEEDIPCCIQLQRHILAACSFRLWVEEPDMLAACEALRQARGGSTSDGACLDALQVAMTARKGELAAIAEKVRQEQLLQEQQEQEQQQAAAQQQQQQQRDDRGGCNSAAAADGPCSPEFGARQQQQQQHVRPTGTVLVDASNWQAAVSAAAEKLLHKLQQRPGTTGCVTGAVGVAQQPGAAASAAAAPAAAANKGTVAAATGSQDAAAAPSKDAAAAGAAGSKLAAAAARAGAAASHAKPGVQQGHSLASQGGIQNPARRSSSSSKNNMMKQQLLQITMQEESTAKRGRGSAVADPAGPAGGAAAGQRAARHGSRLGSVFGWLLQRRQR